MWPSPPWRAPPPASRSCLRGTQAGGLRATHASRDIVSPLLQDAGHGTDPQSAFFSFFPRLVFVIIIIIVIIIVFRSSYLRFAV